MNWKVEGNKMEKVIKKLEKRMSYYFEEIERYKELIKEEQKIINKSLKKQIFGSVQYHARCAQEYVEQIDSLNDMLFEANIILKMIREEEND